MFPKKKYTIHNIPKYIVGNGMKVPTIHGHSVKYINLDNAASTPILQPVVDYILEYLPWYSSVHRGTGFKSQLSTELYDYCHVRVAEFFGADQNHNTVIFTKNTTEAINKLSFRLGLNREDYVLTSIMEHHSNDLPWRSHCNIEHIGLTKDLTLDLNHLEELIKKHRDRVKLITITGASNVTGQMNPIYEIAEIAHRNNIPILVDGAQLAPHRTIDVLPDDHPSHIDFLTCSGHKMYAPLGTGVLIGHKRTFERGVPEYTGGGTIKSVTTKDVYWADPPEKEEAGSPNTVGAIALKKSMDILEEIGMEEISQHEEELTQYIIRNLSSHPDIIIYGNTQLDRQSRVGVISFNIAGMNHALVAAILSYEYGIAVRSGCFCAHPYIHRLLNLSKGDIYQQQQQILQSNLYNVVGMVRISFGMYNTLKEVKRFLEAIDEISSHNKDHYYLKRYFLDRKTGSYFPRDFNPNFKKYFDY